METHQSPEQILASAMQLPLDQRKAIAQELLQSIPTGQADSTFELDQLRDQIEQAQRGELSNKSFSQIKHEARLEN